MSLIGLGLVAAGAGGYALFRIFEKIGHLDAGSSETSAAVGSLGRRFGQALEAATRSLEKLDASVAMLGETVTGLETRVDEASAEIAKLETRATKLEVQATKYETQSTNLNSEVTRLQTRATELETEVAKLDRRDAALDAALKQQSSSSADQVARLQLLAFDTEFALRELALHQHLARRDAATTADVGARLSSYLSAAAGKFASQHGHVLLVRSILALEGGPGPERVPGQAPRRVLEIGTTREVLYSQCSSTKIGLICDILGLEFVTVDMDPDNSTRLRERMAQVSSSARMEVSEGARYLRQSGERFAYAYLDSFDFFHEKHSRARLASYRAYLNLALSDDNSWKHHKEVAELLVTRMEPGGVIVLDDTWREGEGWGGKGKLAVGLLEAHGFQIAHEGQTCLVMFKA